MKQFFLNHCAENHERKKRDSLILKMKERMMRHKEIMKNGHKRRKLADDTQQPTTRLSLIENLPDELLKHIFELLDLRYIFTRLIQTNKL